MRRTVLFFRVVIACFALAALFALVCFAKVTGTEKEIDKLTDEIASLENEVTMLEISEENILSLGELEQYAKTVLDMTPISIDTVRYIHLSD